MLFTIVGSITSQNGTGYKMPRITVRRRRCLKMLSHRIRHVTYGTACRTAPHRAAPNGIPNLP